MGERKDRGGRFGKNNRTPIHSGFDAKIHNFMSSSFDGSVFSFDKINENKTKKKENINKTEIIRNEKSRHGMHARAVWKDIQTLFRTRAGGPTLYEGRARARARALSTRRFSRVSALCLTFLISLAHIPLPRPPSLCALPYGKT